ncbi:DUF1643 domain-containing protein [Peribacillus sp. NPDC058075]|uniref:DUF1643 domain-containing protein n=1 Tax=unclassified Peribacillus TaxID=2675266 RepID=UPI0036DF7C78
MKEMSKSGVLLHQNFRDALIIDKYDSEFQQWRGKKLEHLKSQNSEDAMTWNVFRTLKQINPVFWLPSLFKKSFQKEFSYPLDAIDLRLWKKLNPPSNLSIKEGSTEVDIIIESKEFIWCIEAKYKSDISLSTSNDLSRNQVIRNIDVGLDYANGRDFYFALLILDEKHSSKGFSITSSYRNSFNCVKRGLTNRIDSLNNLKGIGIFTWFDILKAFRKLTKIGETEFERYIAKQAENWLRNKIVILSEPINGASFDETRTFRYSLTRIWDSKKEKVVFIGLNPSTADEVKDDPTLKRCINFAKRWHNGKYGSLEMVNLFSYRSTDFDMLKNFDNPIGIENDKYLLNAVRNASLVVIAWGEKGIYRNRHIEVLKLFKVANIPVYCLDILKCGQPKHPLYAKKELTPISFNLKGL